MFKMMSVFSLELVTRRRCWSGVKATISASLPLGSKFTRSPNAGTLPFNIGIRLTVPSSSLPTAIRSPPGLVATPSGSASRSSGLCSSPVIPTGSRLTLVTLPGSVTSSTSSEADFSRASTA